MTKALFGVIFVFIVSPSKTTLIVILGEEIQKFGIGSNLAVQSTRINKAVSFE